VEVEKCWWVFRKKCSRIHDNVANADRVDKKSWVRKKLSDLDVPCGFRVGSVWVPCGFRVGSVWCVYVFVCVCV
jgi:hypothetical protein